MDPEPNSSSASSNSNGSSNNSSSNNSSSNNLLAQLPMLQEQAVAAAVDAVDRNEAAAAAVAAGQLLQPPLAAEVLGADVNEIFIAPLLFNNNATPPPSTSASSSSSSSSSSSHNLLQLYQQQQHHHHRRDHQQQQHDSQQQQQQQQEPQSQSDLHQHRHHHHHAPEHVHIHEAESEHAHHHQHQHSHSPSPSSLHQQHQHHTPSSPYAPLQLQHHHHPDQLQQHRPEEVEDERQQQPEDEHEQHSLLDDNAIADTIDVEAAGIDDVEEDEGDDVLSADPAPSTSREQHEQLTTASSSAAGVVVAAESEPPFLLQEEGKQSPSQPPGYSTHSSYPYAQHHHHYHGRHGHHNHYAHFQQHEHQQLQPQHHHHHSSIGACSNIYGFDETSRGNGATMFSHIVALNDAPQTSSGLPGGHSHSHGNGGGGTAAGGGGSGSGSGSSESRHHQHQHVDRLKMLYPNVNENETPLPRCWSPHDKCLSIGLSQNNLRVHYKGLNKQHNDAASVRTAYPIPASCGLYYFEVKIISKGKNGYMGIGLTAQQFRMNRLPGWDKQSYGYHGDDGNSFSSSGNGQSYGPKFSTGDIIGCCINFVNNTCFYTKNGVDLGIAFRDLPTKLYPTVGLQTPGEEVDANFGQEPFKFDQIEEMMKQMRTETKASIYDFPMPAAQGDPTTLLHDMVSSYLVHNGYSQTADAFGRATGQTFREDMLSIRNRQKILKLIMCGRMGQAIEMTLRSYPGLLENNQNLWFMLKCRQFVEMVNGSDVEYCPKFNTNSIVIYVPPKTAPHNQTSVIRSTRRFQQNGKTPADDVNGSDSVSASASASASGNGVTNATPNTPTPEDNGTTSMPATLMTAPTETTTPPNPAVIQADNQHEQETQEQCSQQELKPAAPPNCDAGGDAKNHESYNNASTNLDYTSDVDMENGGGAVASDATAAHTTNGMGTGAATSSLFRNSKFHNCNSSLDLDEEMDIDVSPSTSRFSNGIERILEFGKELSLMGQHLEKENCMSDDDRQMLEDAFSLIAYSNPWSSPLGWQLCPTKRESVCTALNSAILESMNYPRRPPLDVCVAHASELLKIMAQSSLGACAFVNIDDVFPQN